MKRFASLMLALGFVALTAGAADAQSFRTWTHSNTSWHNSWNNNNWNNNWNTNNNWNNNWRWRQQQMRRIYHHDNGRHLGWRHHDHDRRWW
jgi:hypothetical protein